MAASFSRNPIYVEDKLFLGRVEEQKQWRAALTEVLNPPPGEDLPYIFLLYGDGGMGKTTLAKRCADIARDEVPFEGEFQILWVDWEDERGRYASLRARREDIRPETVFDILHQKAIAAGWGREFSAYQGAVNMRQEAEKKALAALEPGGERDEFADLRSAGAGALAKILRLALPIGEAGEKLAQAFLEAGIRVGAEQAAHWRARLETRLRARLDPRQYEIFLNPNQQLARALAEGLKKVAARKPLLLFFDTYEIVDRADLWLREVMRAAGPRLVWVISGRNDLARSRQFGDEFFKGYAEDFPRRLVARDLLQLAQQDVREIFAEAAPERALDETAAAALSRATRGIPLAIHGAAEMWRKGAPLAEIIGDIDEATPRGQILQKMTARYFLHVPEADKPALYALALARGDVEILRAMLRPADDAPFNLEALLARLERDYASVHRERARLHDDPEFFLREQLKNSPVLRSDQRVRLLNQRAAETLRARLEKLQADLPCLEERCADDDWVKAALDLSETLFWLDEHEAWQWLIPRFVEGLAYSRELRRGLLAAAQRWNAALSAGGKKHLKALRAADEAERSSDKWADLLDELTRLERLNYLAGEGEPERRAILDWQRGKLLFAREKYPEALEACERAERGLPKQCEALQKLLGEALDDLAGEFLWPKGRRSAVYSPEAERILPKVVVWLPKNQGAWYRLGVALKLGGRYDEALAAYQRASELDPQYAAPHNGMGIVYDDLKRYDEALAAYQRAIELDPQYAAPHNGMGNVYGNLKRYDEALAAYQRASELDPQDAYPHNGMGIVYWALGRYDEALAAFKRAIELDPQSAAPHNGMGIVYDDLTRYDEALAAYQRASELDPQDAYPHNGMGNVYRTLGRHDEALAAYQRAIELDPKDGSSRSSLASILRKLGREAEAQEQINMARPLMEKESEYNRACFESICGNVDEALALLRVALEKKQISLEWARRDPDFDWIREEARFKAMVGG